MAGGRVLNQQVVGALADVAVFRDGSGAYVESGPLPAVAVHLLEGMTLEDQRVSVGRGLGRDHAIAEGDLE